MKMKHISLLWVAALLMFGAFAFHAFIREDGRQEPQYEERSERFQESASWTTIPDSVIELCMPAPLKTTPEFILRKKSYVVSYNQDTRMPNWVAWQLTAEHTDGELKRMNNFHEEENCPSPRATLQDYKGSGWSRGHMCPAGDNKWNAQALDETFLLTNVCPQNHNLNKNDWNDLEKLCRRWARKYGKVFIVCGPVLRGTEHKLIGPRQRRITVPEAFYKVVLRMGKNPAAIGFVYDNKGKHQPMKQAVRSVDEIEKLTGIDFFHQLDDRTELAVETEADLADW